MFEFKFSVIHVILNNIIHLCHFSVSSYFEKVIMFFYYGCISLGSFTLIFIVYSHFRAVSQKGGAKLAYCHASIMLGLSVHDNI